MAEQPADTPDSEHLWAPEDAFSILGDETRLTILLELADAFQTESDGLSFSELRRRVGVEDSGQFNYHLDKLSEGFIEKADDKYSIRSSGLAVVSAVYAGTYGDGSGDETAESSWDCPKCGDPL
ncbi:winged helix-turn-helix domain-containing protein [Halovenus rubra]|uniref:Winged helix-turn-helix domain-containing protein n=2 Tax=Halovenus rubra TaxID=869890 RepID=A0ABD5X0M9_9EURY|nr:helix-turn-helix domain-containing protein [Halovenus rubra]